MSQPTTPSVPGAARTGASRRSAARTAGAAGDRSGGRRTSVAAVELFWIPLGAGGHVVRLNGRVFERLVALRERRAPLDLYHAALIVRVPEAYYTIESTPVPDANGPARGVVGGGPVGSRLARRLRIFRYEIRCWPGGVIPDLAYALPPCRLTTEETAARRVLESALHVPTPVWGRDELRAGEMWNSNSIVSWLLARSGFDMGTIAAPDGGRAPGWEAGLVVAARDRRAVGEAVPRSDVGETVPRPEEIAPGVHRLDLGAGWLAANVYFIGSVAAWCLVDAGWPRDEAAIRRAAEALFGAGTRPAAIVLTHAHPDHAGAARALARVWACPVLVHPDELPLASGDAEAIHRYAGPLDRYAILPAMRLAGRRRMRATLARGSVADVVAALDPAAPVPGLAEWALLPTPGHTPGHIALVRRDDGVAVTGDALNTVELNSPWGAVRRTRRLCGPPRVATWDWRRAVASAVALAGSRPSVIAPGHGAPMGGDELAGQTQAFLARHGR